MGERTGYRIGDAARQLAVSVDTLRYYERIGLLPAVDRSASGVRVYRNRDLSRIRFIRRAQAMDFTLAEIADLLRLRERRGHARTAVRRMTRDKIREIDARIGALTSLRAELERLLAACPGDGRECPILAGLAGAGAAGG